MVSLTIIQGLLFGEKKRKITDTSFKFLSSKRCRNPDFNTALKVKFYIMIFFSKCGQTSM